MDRSGNLTAFVRTADLGSFAAAGRVLGLSASAVGKSVAKLEHDLGVRLFQRTTRTIRLTEEGRLFHERCRRVLDDLDDAWAIVAGSRDAPRGRLRVSTPVVTYHILMPLMPEFTALYPEIDLDFDFNDRLVDLVEEGVDIAIRSGELPDSRLMSRVFCSFRQMLFASPAYLERHGTPLKPRDLDGHLAIRYRFLNSGRMLEWPLILPSDEPEPRPRTVFTCNNMEAMRGATLGGLGIGVMPDFLVHDAVEAGTLRTVLPDHVGGPRNFNMIWPSSRHLSPKVRVFVDFMQARLGGV
ncbi:LysR family transcriptional regulator [Labrys okinawensis]|uniref:LysR family transcriptional regulator n=1 Tax=Labrys okinawensis TaxID=346911 RepID=A0A2S9Q9R6_9HYPH|nr:LysR family transcriptional regulator [Labrys okinawensis]PRH86098.1 LysR family transcriptional regulator [Labrys okinawensis]